MSKRVLAVASSGGHWVQLGRLRPAFEGLDVAFASVVPSYAADVSGHRYYTFDDVSRFNKAKLLVVALQIFRILSKEQPDVVITTGAAPGLITLALAKTIFRAKTIWIDSMANCEQMSTSGEQARRFADIWLTQWAHLSNPHGPECWGGVV